jgi:hypothetical protein
MTVRTVAVVTGRRRGRDRVNSLRERRRRRRDGEHAVRDEADPDVLRGPAPAPQVREGLGALKDAVKGGGRGVTLSEQAPGGEMTEG